MDGIYACVVISLAIIQINHAAVTGPPCRLLGGNITVNYCEFSPWTSWLCKDCCHGIGPPAVRTRFVCCPENMDIAECHATCRISIALRNQSSPCATQCSNTCSKQTSEKQTTAALTTIRSTTTLTTNPPPKVTTTEVFTPKVALETPKLVTQPHIPCASFDDPLSILLCDFTPWSSWLCGECCNGVGPQARRSRTLCCNDNTDVYACHDFCNLPMSLRYSSAPCAAKCPNTCLKQSAMTESPADTITITPSTALAIRNTESPSPLFPIINPNPNPNLITAMDAPMPTTTDFLGCPLPPPPYTPILFIPLCQFTPWTDFWCKDECCHGVGPPVTRSRMLCCKDNTDVAGCHAYCNHIPISLRNESEPCADHCPDTCTYPPTTTLLTHTTVINITAATPVTPVPAAIAVPPIPAQTAVSSVTAPTPITPIATTFAAVTPVTPINAGRPISPIVAATPRTPIAGVTPITPVTARRLITPVTVPTLMTPITPATKPTTQGSGGGPFITQVTAATFPIVHPFSTAPPSTTQLPTHSTTTTTKTTKTTTTTPLPTPPPSSTPLPTYPTPPPSSTPLPTYPTPPPSSTPLPTYPTPPPSSTPLPTYPTPPPSTTPLLTHSTTTATTKITTLLPTTTATTKITTPLPTHSTTTATTKITTPLPTTTTTTKITAPLPTTTTTKITTPLPTTTPSPIPFPIGPIVNPPSTVPKTTKTSVPTFPTTTTSTTSTTSTITTATTPSPISTYGTITPVPTTAPVTPITSTAPVTSVAHSTSTYGNGPRIVAMVIENTTIDGICYKSERDVAICGGECADTTNWGQCIHDCTISYEDFLCRLISISLFVLGLVIGATVVTIIACLAYRRKKRKKKRVVSPSTSSTSHDAQPEIITLQDIEHESDPEW